MFEESQMIKLLTILHIASTEGRVGRFYGDFMLCYRFINHSTKNLKMA